MPREKRMCEACEQGAHWACGMQTWCECDCDGAEGIYDLDEDYLSDGVLIHAARMWNDL